MSLVCCNSQLTRKEMKRQGIVRIRCYFMDQGYDWAGLQQATEIKVYEASRSLSHSLISASPCEFVTLFSSRIYFLCITCRWSVKAAASCLLNLKVSAPATYMYDLILPVSQLQIFRKRDSFTGCQALAVKTVDPTMQIQLPEVHSWHLWIEMAFPQSRDPCEPSQYLLTNNQAQNQTDICIQVRRQGAWLWCPKSGFASTNILPTPSTNSSFELIQRHIPGRSVGQFLILSETRRH